MPCFEGRQRLARQRDGHGLAHGKLTRAFAMNGHGRPIDRAPN